MAVDSPLPRRLTVAALIGLTVVTGLVDAVSYLQLGHTFVANMTGNLVFLGFSLDPSSGLSALASLVAIGGFLLGAVAGGRLATHLAHRTRLWLGLGFGLEAVAMGLVAVLGAVGVLEFASGAYLTIVILALALGLQNSTVRHLGVADLTTTVLTLALTGLAADSVLARGRGGKPARRLLSIGAMLAGAAIGALLVQVSPTLVIGLAALIAALVAGSFGLLRLPVREVA